MRIYSSLICTYTYNMGIQSLYIHFHMDIQSRTNQLNPIYRASRLIRDSWQPYSQVSTPPEKNLLNRK